jgi:hypothetical protein
MKGFSEIRGQMFRMSYDPIIGQFVNVVVPRGIEQSLSIEASERKTPENFEPKIIRHVILKTPPAPAQAQDKKRA